MLSAESLLPEDFPGFPLITIHDAAIHSVEVRAYVKERRFRRHAFALFPGDVGFVTFPRPPKRTVRMVDFSKPEAVKTRLSPMAKQGVTPSLSLHAIQIKFPFSGSNPWINVSRETDHLLFAVHDCEVGMTRVMRSIPRFACQMVLPSRMSMASRSVLSQGISHPILSSRELFGHWPACGTRLLPSYSIINVLHTSAGEAPNPC